MRHPTVRDLGLRAGIDGCPTPSDIHAVSALVRDGLEAVIERQRRTIRELTAENAALLRELGRA